MMWWGKGGRGKEKERRLWSERGRCDAMLYLGNIIDFFMVLKCTRDFACLFKFNEWPCVFACLLASSSSSSSFFHESHTYIQTKTYPPVHLLSRDLLFSLSSFLTVWVRGGGSQSPLYYLDFRFRFHFHFHQIHQIPTRPSSPQKGGK